MGSATPALESWRNAERGRYTRLAMPSRVGNRPMPAVEIIDLRNEKVVVGGLSESLRQAMNEALDAGGQVILLLNRRHHILRGEATRRDLVGIKPNPHRVFARAEDIDVADTIDSRELVPNLKQGIIAGEKLIERSVR